MKLYIRLICTGMLLVPAYHNVLAQEAEEESEYSTTANVKDYRPKKKDFFELSENQKTALAVGGAALGALAVGAATYGAYQYATTPDTLATETPGAYATTGGTDEKEQAKFYEGKSSKAHYANVLGVDENASPGEIKKAYFQKARQYHPDKNPDNTQEAAEQFKEAEMAYRTLINQY